MNPQKNELLWEELKNGNRTAFDSIFVEHVDALIGYGLRITRDRGLVEDQIQELFVHLWQKRATLGGTDNIRLYLLAAFRRRVFKTLSKYANTPYESLPDSYDFEVQLSHEILLIDEHVSLERKQSLQEAIELLSRRQKEIVFHKYYSGLSCEEIGEVMGLSIGSVYNLTAKAIEALSCRFRGVKKNLKKSS